ncbi:outer membrane transport energization protein ExbD [Fluviicoccus keumensis]|uniref:Outer membrane transport energization protein ExbD n=1 Tax=Fluviicoccus keumensis TaxID=1435465 RepID=A0A4Q7Z8Z2_9GAMM|nr:biopolymer transporter ExbD [Fluviicoccus keumensis]RZU46948.1 outer membrane transport energization protein ExbD [Fluviicoccus keumensis]
MQMNEDKAYDDINITPMLDLSYVLLVIFIIMTTAAVQGMKVNLPKASDQPSLSKPKTVAITITNDGKVFMDAVPVTMAELEDRMRAKKAENPEVPVVVRGDSETQYHNVVDVLALLGKLDITQLGLVTQRLVQ